MDIKEKRCKNCGAPLHGYKCDYCGTEYEAPSVQMHFVERTGNIQTIACQTAIPLDKHIGVDPVRLAEVACSNIAEQISRELLKCMDVDTWVDPKTMQQMFGGRIRVVKPH